jgi:hypothetical protein
MSVVHILQLFGAQRSFEDGALTLGFDLALVEELNGLLVKVILATGVLTALAAYVLVAGLLHHHEITANHQPRSPDKRLHVSARLWVTGVQHPGKDLIT